MIEASLRGRLIAGRTVAKAIYITGGSMIFAVGVIFAITPIKKIKVLASAKKIQHKLLACKNNIQSYELEAECLKGSIDKCKLE